jgi:hypothetical protein
MDYPDQPSEIYLQILQHLTQVDIYCLANASINWNRAISNYKLLQNKINLAVLSSPEILLYIVDLVPKTILCKIAFRVNSRDAIEWARANNYPWTPSDIRLAAKYQHFDLLKWAHQLGNYKMVL